MRTNRRKLKAMMMMSFQIQHVGMFEIAAMLIILGLMIALASIGNNEDKP